MSWTITGRVRGIVRFPEHPRHEGAWGLEGGEDVTAVRSTFASAGQAMTWCRRVLDGEVTPRNVEPAGELLEPHGPPVWNDAEVVVAYVETWERYAPDPVRYGISGRGWHELDSGDRPGKLVRTD